MKLIIIFLMYLSIDGLHAEKVRYDNYKLYKVTPTNLDGVKTLEDLELSGTPDFMFWNSVGSVGLPVTIMVPPDKASNLQVLCNNLKMDYKLIMENVQENIDLQETPTIRSDGFGWERYHTLDEINNWMQEIATEFYSVVSLIEGGISYEGRIIYGLKVSYSSDNANNSVFLESNIHSNEWITSAVSTYILHELLTSTDETVRYVAESHDWYFFPVFNPDGFVYAHTTDRLWRKTRFPHSILCTGADPNRNWDYFWNSVGTSNSPCTQIYRGPAPFSEPSCRSLSQFIEGVADRLVGYISFHSFSQLLLIPYGYTPEHLDNYYDMYEIGLVSVEALAQRYGTHYYVGTTYETIYPASGTSIDWVKGKFNIPIVYCYELRDRGDYGFLLPPEQIIPTAEETLDSFVTIFIEYEKLIASRN